MNNLVFGIATVIACTAGYFFAWKAFRRQDHKRSLLLIVLCGLALRIFTGSDLYLHSWDERYHALVARHLTEHPLKPTLYENPVLPYHADDWIANHVWLEKPPLPLWAMAASLKTFGTSEIAARFPSLLVSTLAIWLTYLIGLYLFDRRTALLAAFLHSINGLLIEVAGGKISSDVVETFFVFFIELGIFVSVYAIHHRKTYAWSALIGLLTAFALLSKWNPGMIVVVVWFFGAWFSGYYDRKQIFLCFVISVATALGVYGIWIAYILHSFPEEANWILRKFIFAYSKTLEEHSGPFYYYLAQMRILFGELVYIPLLIGIYLLFKKKRSWRMIIVAVWWIIPFLIFSFAATKRQTYLLMAAPAFFLTIAQGWCYLERARFLFRPKWIVSIILILLLVLPLRYGLERVKPFELRDRDPAWAIELRNIKTKIPSGKNVTLFNVKRPVELMFYNDCTAYPQLPDSSTINTLIRNKNIVVINLTNDAGQNEFAERDSLILGKVCE